MQTNEQKTAADQENAERVAAAYEIILQCNKSLAALQEISRTLVLIRMNARKHKDTPRTHDYDYIVQRDNRHALEVMDDLETVSEFALDLQAATGRECKRLDDLES